jgi:hypothetical protein
MRRPRPAAVLVTGTLLLAATGLLAGCGAQTGTTETASTGSAPASVVGTGTVSEEPDGATDAGAPEDTPPFPGDTAPVSAEPVDPAGLTVTDVRFGAHDGFDRVVFDVAGSGTPGWAVEYVDGATAEGTGDPIDLAGPAHLRVVVTGVSYPYESGVEERARGAVTGAAASAVTGVWYDGTFEGQALAYLGTTAEQPFRVYALSNPTRVVVEVAAG